MPWFRRHIEVLFTAANVPWPVSFVSTNSIAALKALVMSGDGVSISSSRLMKLEIAAGYLAAIPLSKPRFPREITLRTRRSIDPTPPLRRFLETLRSVAAEMRLDR
jgi:DNA-binding transcriptional LysR family regulator